MKPPDPARRKPVRCAEILANCVGGMLALTNLPRQLKSLKGRTSKPSVAQGTQFQAAASKQKHPPGFRTRPHLAERPPPVRECAQAPKSSQIPSNELSANGQSCGRGHYERFCGIESPRSQTDPTRCNLTRCPADILAPIPTSRTRFFGEPILFYELAHYTFNIGSYSGLSARLLS